MRKELVRQAQRYDELERSRGTPQRGAAAAASAAAASAAATKEDLQIAEQMQQLARMIKSEPTTPVRGGAAEQARSAAAASTSGSMDEKEVSRRMASLDVRESRVEARETLLAKLTEVREALKKTEAAALAAERRERETAQQLETAQKLLASRDREKAALVVRCREQEASLDKMEQETDQAATNMGRQLSLLQTERAELRRQLESKLSPEVGAAAAAQIKLAVAEEALTRAEESRAQQIKYLNEELASQRRLRETYEEVNAAVKGA
jgi:hypothetical protein